MRVKLSSREMAPAKCPIRLRYPWPSTDPQGTSKLRFNILKAQLFRACPCNDQHVSGRLQFAPMQTKELSYQSLHPVPSDCVPNLTAHCDPEPTIRLGARERDHNEVPTTVPTVPQLYSEELRPLANPPMPRKRRVRISRVRAWAESRRQVASGPWLFGS